ncbi:MAG: glycosyltransferase [Patescibacteria group bacterium]
MNVSAIITANDSSIRLDACLNALARQTTRNDEIIIVHNGKQPKTLTKTSRPLLVWLSSSDNHMLKIKNAAAKQAKGDVLLFINDDCIIPNGYIAYIKHVNRIDQRTLYQGKNRFVFPKSNWVGDVFNAMDTYSWVQTKKQLAWKNGRHLTYLHSECFCLKKATLRQLAQWFSPKTIPLDDGAVLCIALQLLGYTIQYAPQLDIRHYKDNLTSLSLYKKAYMQEASRGLLEKRFTVDLKIKRLFPQYDSSRVSLWEEEAYIICALSHKSFIFLIFIAGFLVIRRLCRWFGSLVARLCVVSPTSIMHSTQG